MSIEEFQRQPAFRGAIRRLLTAFSKIFIHGKISPHAFFHFPRRYKSLQAFSKTLFMGAIAFQFKRHFCICQNQRRVIDGALNIGLFFLYYEVATSRALQVLVFTSVYFQRLHFVVVDKFFDKNITTKVCDRKKV